MSEHVANGCRCEEPPEPEASKPVNLAGIVAAYGSYTEKDDGHHESAAAHLLSSIPALVAELSAARAELADWRTREHRQEFVFVRPGEDPSKPPALVPRIYASPEMVAEFDADPDAHSVGGVPWVRTVTTSRWERHTPAPF